MELVEVLREDAETDRLSNLHIATARLHASAHDLEKRRLAGAVLAEDAVAVARSDEPGEVLDHRRIAVAGGDILHLDDELAKTRDGKPLELDRVPQRGVVCDQGLCLLDAELRLRRACLGSMGKPVELLAQNVLPSVFRCLRHALALDTLLDVGRIAALERIDRAVMDFPHVLADLIEEPPVVRHDEEGSRAFGPPSLQMLGQPGDGMHIEMVRRLVHEHDIPVADKKAGKVAPPALSSGKVADPCIPVDADEELIDDGADLRIRCPLIFRHIADDAVSDRIFVVELV